MKRLKPPKLFMGEDNKLHPISPFKVCNDCKHCWNDCDEHTKYFIIEACENYECLVKEKKR